MHTPQDILNFWFGDDPSQPLKNSAKWWKKDPAFDAEVERNFSVDLENARGGKYDAWKSQPQSCLAWILLLDQFSRNIFRNQTDSFSQDALALEASLQGQARGLDKELSPVQRQFFYLPMMHSEAVAMQRRSVQAYENLAAEAPPELREAMRGAAQFARRHAEIVERFGRFPHRNAILGRASSAEELEFLKQPGSSF